MTKADALVANGAEFLDEMAPGWEHKLNFQSLEMSGPCRCVLGQVFFDEAVQKNVTATDIDGTRQPSGFYWAINELESFDTSLYGFDYDEEVGWIALRDAWVALVKNRFDTGALSG